MQQVEKINSAVSQAQALAAKKAKTTRLTGIKGTVLGGNNSNMLGSIYAMNKYFPFDIIFRVRSSRSAGLNNATKGSQYLDNSRNLSRHAINIASRMNISDLK
jgi:hypothetical protein